jgi:isopentenyldiphosphate isomerase
VGSEELEYLDVVDADDAVVGRDTRENVHRGHRIHRGVHVLVVNARGEILVQLRSARLDNHPGHLDASAGGHVQSGETYQEAAGRELLEELGCHAEQVEHLCTYDGYSVRQFEKRGLFLHRCDGPFRPDPEAVDGIEFQAAERLVEVFATRPCTEGFMRSVSLYFDHLAAHGTPTPAWRWTPGPEPRPSPPA